MHADDVRVVQVREGAGLIHKALQGVGVVLRIVGIIQRVHLHGGDIAVCVIGGQVLLNHHMLTALHVLC